MAVTTSGMTPQRTPFTLRQARRVRTSCKFRSRSLTVTQLARSRRLTTQLRLRSSCSLTQPPRRSRPLLHGRCVSVERKNFTGNHGKQTSRDDQLRAPHPPAEQRSIGRKAACRLLRRVSSTRSSLRVWVTRSESTSSFTVVPPLRVLRGKPTGPIRLLG